MSLCGQTCLSDVIKDFQIPTVLRRFDKGQYIKGVWESSPAKEYSILAVIQNATQKDLQDLPEGRRMSETIKIYTTFPLFAVRKQKEPDQILWHDQWFEIHAEINQSEYGGYYKSIGVLKVL